MTQEINDNQLSVLAGLNQEELNTNSGLETDIEETAVGENIEEYQDNDSDPYSAQTSLTFSSSPVSKIVFVFGGVAIGFFIIWLFLNNFPNKSTSVTDNNLSSLESEIDLQTLPSDSETASLKTDLALAEQKRQLEMIKQQKSKQIEETQSPELAPEVIQPKPQVQKVFVESKTEPLPIDPLQARATALVLGSYGGSSLNQEASRRDISNQNQIPSPISEVNDVSKLDNNSQYNPSLPPSPPSTSISQYPEQTTNQYQLEAPLFEDQPISMQVVAPGTIVQGYLADPIVIDSQQALASQKFRLILTEPILSTNGDVIAPENNLATVPTERRPMVIASVLNISPTGLVILQAESLIVGNRLIPIPKNTVSVQSFDGSLLLAEAKIIENNPNNFDSGDLASDIIGTVGDLGIIDFSIGRQLERNSRRGQGQARNKNYRNNWHQIWIIPPETPIRLFFAQPFRIQSKNIQPFTNRKTQIDFLYIESDNLENLKAFCEINKSLCYSLRM